MYFQQFALLVWCILEAPCEIRLETLVACFRGNLSDSGIRVRNASVGTERSGGLAEVLSKLVL